MSLGLGSTLRSSLALLSVVDAIGRTSGRRWDCSGLVHLAQRCFGTKWYNYVLGIRSTRDDKSGNEDDSILLVFKLDKYASNPQTTPE